MKSLLLLKCNIVRKYYFLLGGSSNPRYRCPFYPYWAFSALGTFPLPRNTIASFTCWSPSARMHSCSVACLLSRLEEGWETQTQTCLLPVTYWSILYLFFGVHRPYFTSWVEWSRLLLDLTASLRSRWNFWIVCLPSSAACFFLYVLLLNEIPCRFLNL